MQNSNLLYLFKNTHFLIYELKIYLLGTLYKYLFYVHKIYQIYLPLILLKINI